MSESVVLFGLLIDRMGLLASTALMVIICRLSRPGYRWGETVLLAVRVSVFCTALFYFVLRVQMPLLPH